MSVPAEEVTGPAVENGSNDHIPIGFRNTAGKGRKVGATNLATREAKKVAAMLADREADSFSEWIHKVAETKPDRACELYLELLKIIMPMRGPAAAFAAQFTAPDGQQSAVSMKVRGLFALPEPVASPLEAGE